MSEQQSEEVQQIEKLYEFSERLNASKDKSQNVEDYEGIIKMSKTSMKAKQLASQLIPRYFKFFPSKIVKLDYIESRQRYSSSSSSSSSYRQIFTARSSSWQRDGGSKVFVALPGSHMKWASLGSVRNSRFASGFTPLQPKPLDSIMDLARAKTKSPEELTSIWDDYHLGRGHIGITMKAQLYRLLEQRASECRYFVIPLWRGNGYITMFAQVEAPRMIFTGLEDYKARGTQASPYLTTTFYTELSETKDLVFIRGDVVFTSKLTDEEAKWIMETAQSFYLNDSWYKLLERFNKHTHDFEFKDVLQALDMPLL